MSTLNTIPTKPNKAALIRELLAQGKDAKAIAAEIGCKVQYVHSVRNYERVKSAKAKAKAAYQRKKAIVAGAVKRKYKKSGKYAKKVKAQPEVRTQYIEVEVPQPHYNLTWGQRFKALFTGRV